MTSAERPEAEVPASHAGILETAVTAMVSTVGHKDGLISTNPVAFDWDGRYIQISTLKSRVKYRNLLANPQITFCALDAKDLSRYIEIRGYAELSEDPDGALNRKLFNRISGKDWPNLDEPGAERVVVKIVPAQVSAPAIYGGRFDRRRSS